MSENQLAKTSADYFCGMYGEFYRGFKKEGLSKMWAAIMAFLFVYTLIILPAQKKSQPIDVLGELLKVSPAARAS